MRRTAILLICLMLGLPGSAYPQQPSLIADSAGFHIASSILRRVRRVDVLLPASYKRTGPDRHYPVVVVFDGESSMRAISAVSGELSRNGQIPDMIYVGIENVSGDPNERVYDLTPPGMSVSGSVFGQGGDKFLDFIERELLPAVDRQFRGGLPRVMIGHSSGGILATYAAATRPSFRGIVAIDTPVELEKGWLIDRLEARAKGASPAPLRFAAYQAKFSWPDAAWQRVTSAAPPTWMLRRESLRLEGHETVYMLGAYLGLRELFSDYSRVVAQERPAAQIMSYYSAVGGKLGADVPPPSRVLSDLVDDLMWTGHAADARSAFATLVRAYGAPADSAQVASEIAEAERQPPPKETVEELLSAPPPSPDAARRYLGEWVGRSTMDPTMMVNPVSLRVRLDSGRVVAETKNPDAPAGMSDWRRVDYLAVTKDGLTWGRLNGMRPRGVMLWETRAHGDTLSGRGRWGGINVPEGMARYVTLVRKAP